MKYNRNSWFAAALFISSLGAINNHLWAESQSSLQGVHARFEVAARQACADRGVKPCSLLSFTSKPLSDDINLYYALLQVGPGQFDRIGISHLVTQHRAGREPGMPGLFFVHGSLQGFFHSFINESALLQNPGPALWLAQRGVDVWGIDLRFALVPAETTDFSFMAGWDVQTSIDDVLIATRLARHLRRMSGQHFGKLHLTGHSFGASIVYGVANAEAVIPERDQDIGDMIPIDTIYKLPPSDTAGKGLSCAIETDSRSAISQGVFNSDNRSLIAIGEAARANPDGPSPEPGLTNTEFVLGIGCANIFAPAFPFHGAACIRDARGIPSSGRFSATPLIINVYATGYPYGARASTRDYFGIPCDTNNFPYDDHIADIRIPSLYIGAAGGFGVSGTYTNSLLGSSDKATIFIQILPPGESANDFGHVEPFIGNDAAMLVWQPMLEWIRNHENDR